MADFSANAPMEQNFSIDAKRKLQGLPKVLLDCPECRAFILRSPVCDQHPRRQASKCDKCITPQRPCESHGWKNCKRCHSHLPQKGIHSLTKHFHHNEMYFGLISKEYDEYCYVISQRLTRLTNTPNIGHFAVYMRFINNGNFQKKSKLLKN
jgi:hypothetical protein